MASSVEICNRALQAVGETTITSLSEATEAARQCNAAFIPVRQRLIRGHPWNRTTMRVALPKLTTTPLFNYDFEYQLPSDCLVVYDIDHPGSDIEWRVEGRKILCDIDSPLNILYGKDEPDSEQLDSLFTEVFSLTIAVEICEGLTQSNTKQAKLEDRLVRLTYEAKSVDGGEQTPAKFEEDPWLLARWRR